jgi:hypothetical protein
LHPCRQGDEHRQVEVELGDCYLEEEELDGHLVQCAQSVHSARLVQLAQLAQLAQLVNSKQVRAQQELHQPVQAQEMRVLAVQLALYVQQAQLT